MQKLGVLLIGSYACRRFSVSSINSKNSTKQEARILAKLIRKGSLSTGNLLGGTFSGSFDLESQSKGPSPHVTRRVTVLNKTFFDYVIQLMSSCAVYEEIVGTQIEISHVKITNDFKLLNVFWFDPDNNIDDIEILEERLQTYAGVLRHNLAQLRIIGKVPIVNFVKYKEIDTLCEIEQRLATADFGADYERSSCYYNSEQSITYSTKTKDEDNNVKPDKVNETFSVTLPKMRQDVLGLDYSKVMQKIQVSVNKKVTAKERRKADANNITSDSGVQDCLTFLTKKEQEMKFKKFLHQREKEERQKRKRARERMDMDNMRQNVYMNDFAENEDFED